MNSFDPMAVVVDWLDACRSGHIDNLLALYEKDAELACACENKQLKGLEELRTYWAHKLVNPRELAFTMDEIAPDGDGALLDYLSHEGVLLRIHFQFGPDGKIVRTRCGPVAASCSKSK